MPREIDFGTPQAPDLTLVATEEELLDFCNRVREAGAADILDALIPSRKGDSNSCLIANALNFSCNVDGAEDKGWSRHNPWFMYISSKLEQSVLDKISAVIGSEPIEVSHKMHSDFYGSVAFQLPEEIGNAAYAFDEGLAFTELARPSEKNFIALIMSNLINFSSISHTSPDLRPVATEEELLEFVNKGRAAGGANLLEALLPSTRSSTRTCLIANALNFSCTVDLFGDGWAMKLPFNLGIEKALDIAEALGCDYDRVHHRINLPQEIGNAAYAFDEGLAFVEYDNERII